jgi:MFS superfamily sulfate permease-like transporter
MKLILIKYELNVKLIKKNILFIFNKEFFAYGVSNIVSSFFNGFPGCVGNI